MDKDQIKQSIIDIDGGFGHGLSFVYPNADLLSTEEQLGIIPFVLESVFTLASFESLRFCSVDVHLSNNDVFTGTPVSSEGIRHPYWLLFAENSPEFIRLETTRVGQQKKTIASLTPESVGQEVNELFKAAFAGAQEELFPGWSSLQFRSVLVKLDEAIVEDNDVLRVTYNGADAYNYAILRDNNGVWAGGPFGYELKEPLSVTVYNLGWELKIVLQLNWSYFYDERFVGKQLIDEVAERLQQLGWEPKHQR